MLQGRYAKVNPSANKSLRFAKHLLDAPAINEAETNRNIRMLPQIKPSSPFLHSFLTVMGNPEVPQRTTKTKQIWAGARERWVRRRREAQLLPQSPKLLFQCWFYALRKRQMRFQTFALEKRGTLNCYRREWKYLRQKSWVSVQHEAV